MHSKHRPLRRRTGRSPSWRAVAHPGRKGRGSAVTGRCSVSSRRSRDLAAAGDAAAAPPGAASASSRGDGPRGCTRRPEGSRAADAPRRARAAARSAGEARCDGGASNRARRARAEGKSRFRSLPRCRGETSGTLRLVRQRARVSARRARAVRPRPPPGRPRRSAPRRSPRRISSTLPPHGEEGELAVGRRAWGRWSWARDAPAEAERGSRRRRPRSDAARGRSPRRPPASSYSRGSQRMWTQQWTASRSGRAGWPSAAAICSAAAQAAPPCRQCDERGARKVDDVAAVRLHDRQHLLARTR